MKKPTITEKDLEKYPGDFHPIIGLLYYDQYNRAQSLIADLADILIKVCKRALTPEDASPQVSRDFFQLLKKYLQENDYWEKMHKETQKLINDGIAIDYHKTTLRAFQKQAEKVYNLPAVKADIDLYMDKYVDQNDITCFYCDKQLDEWKGDLSTEFAIFWSCTKDVEIFNNPDQYVV